VRPRADPVLWQWLLRFALRCNVRDWKASARAKSALLNDSRVRLQDWVRELGLDCQFAETGEDYVFRNARAFEHEHREIPLLRELGIAVELFDGGTYEAMEPALKPGVAGAVRFPGDAMLRPDRYVAELARVAREQDVRIDEQHALLGVEVQGEGVRLHTAAGELHAREVVLAMGAWSPRLARAIGMPKLRLAMQPGKGYSITYSSPSLVPRRPLILRDRSVCVTAWSDGYRLGSTMEFSGYDDTLNARRLDALERGAREFLHEPVGPEVRERWFGWRPMSCDDVPLLGRMPGRQHVWLATGHGMMGIGMSAGTGQLMADLIAGRDTAIDPTPYSPARFS